ncbi:MAG: galactokinase [Deltaproteobacteria bacterium]|jgi:galactokinase|nr:galactokinase [Deltaproteobacteria bacterium]
MTQSKLTTIFEQVFGISGRENELRLFYAPGRVNLIGEHTDYNGGHVLPCALSMGTYALTAPRTDGACRIFSLNAPEVEPITFLLADPWNGAETNWSRYPRAVLSILGERGLLPERGLDVLYYGNLPAGAGLSSSASIEVLTGYAFGAAGGPKIDLVELAKMCRAAENDLVGVKCGIMDQFVSSLGRRERAILLNCETLEHRYCKLALPQTTLVITNSNKPHSLAASSYNQRWRECETALAILRRKFEVSALCRISGYDFSLSADLIEDEVIRRRAKHVITENQRTLEASVLLELGDLKGFGQLMNASHVSMRDDFEISCREMDVLTRLAWSVDGVYGSRMTGGGFGGCTVSLVRDDALETFKRTVEQGYLSEIGYPPTFYVTETSDGVGRVQSLDLTSASDERNDD